MCSPSQRPQNTLRIDLQPPVTPAVDREANTPDKGQQQPLRYHGVQAYRPKRNDRDRHNRPSDRVANERSSVSAPDHAEIIRPTSMYTVA